jgi:Rrf2 family transcriptional regulator, iron-sulfur cluster assembly transcription factor
MKISTQSRYGLRALIDLAYNSDSYSTQVKEISARQSISPRYIEQIFQKLKKAGIIKSTRGPQGGYHLVRKPEEITVGDIVRATEGGNIELVHCSGTKSSKKPACERMNSCLVRDMWIKASHTLMTYLDSITLYDLGQDSMKKGPDGKSSDGIFVDLL